MAFSPTGEHERGLRFTFETGQIEPLGWCYEFEEVPAVNDEQRFYKMTSRLMTVDRNPPYDKIVYENYAGIWIFGCSFRKIRGTLSEPANLAFIYQNGGVIDGKAE